MKFLKRFRLAATSRSVQVRGHEIAYVPSSDIEEFRFSSYEEKEPETLDWIDEFVKEGDVFFDIGANIGIFSLYAAQKTGRSGKVYAFEPESLNFVSLNRNIMANNLGENVVSAPFALCEELKVDWFHLSGKDFFTGKDIISKQSNDKYRSGSALHSFGDEDSNIATFYRYACFGASLDWLVGQELFVQPNHIKLDVDGIELLIFKGAQSVLKDPALRTVLVEINEGDEEIVQILEENGFQLRELVTTPINRLFYRL